MLPLSYGNVVAPRDPPRLDPLRQRRPSSGGNCLTGLPFLFRQSHDHSEPAVHAPPADAVHARHASWEGHHDLLTKTTPERSEWLSAIVTTSSGGLLLFTLLNLGPIPRHLEDLLHRFGDFLVFDDDGDMFPRKRRQRQLVAIHDDVARKIVPFAVGHFQLRGRP